MPVEYKVQKLLMKENSTSLSTKLAEELKQEGIESHKGTLSFNPFN